MAGEISYSCSFGFSKGGLTLDGQDFDLIAQSITVSGSTYIRSELATRTSADAIPLGSVVTCGFAVFFNRGSADIYIRSGSGGANVITIPAGKGYTCYLATSTPYAIAASSTPTLEYMLISA